MRRADVARQPEAEDDEVEGDRKEHHSPAEVDQLDRGEHVQREEHAEQHGHDQRHAAEVEPAGHERDRDHDEEDQVGRSRLDADGGEQEDAQGDGGVVAGESERERAEEAEPEGQDHRQRKWVPREDHAGRNREQEQPRGGCQPARAAHRRRRGAVNCGWLRGAHGLRRPG